MVCLRRGVEAVKRMSPGVVTDNDTLEPSSENITVFMNESTGTSKVFVLVVPVIESVSSTRNIVPISGLIAFSCMNLAAGSSVSSQMAANKVTSRKVHSHPV